jgi:hypothetical protein
VDVIAEVGQACRMDRTFTVPQARALMPDILGRADELIEVRASLVEVQVALSEGGRSPLGGVPEAKAFQARLSELVSWFSGEGLEVKGIAPLLLDFPAQVSGEPALLCWLEGERELGWYHRLPHGFAGRRRIP